MHDPDVVVFDVPYVRVTVWHREPGGADSGRVTWGWWGVSCRGGVPCGDV